MIPLIMGAGMALQAGGAIAKGISGAIRARKAQDAIDSYQRQDLTNVVRDRVGISRHGAEMQSQEMARSVSSSIDALGAGGVRGMVGGIGKIQQASNMGQQQISADLDRQQQQIDQMAVQDDQRIRQMQERREEADLAGLGRELNSGRQDLYGGIGDLGQGLVSGAGMMSMMGIGAKGLRPMTEGVMGAGTIQQANPVMQQSQQIIGGMMPNPYRQPMGVMPMGGGFSAPLMPTR